MKNNYELPMIMSAKNLQAMGFSRSMAYRLLQGDLIPVVIIGKRRFIRHETLLEWLSAQEHRSPSEQSLCENTLSVDNIPMEDAEGGETT